jgi:hypothetical protein
MIGGDIAVRKAMTTPQFFLRIFFANIYEKKIVPNPNKNITTTPLYGSPCERRNGMERK